MFLHRNLCITSAAFPIQISSSSEAMCGMLANRQDVLSSIPSQHWDPSWLSNARPVSSPLLVPFDAFLEALGASGRFFFLWVYTKTGLFSSAVILLGRDTKH